MQIKVLFIGEFEFLFSFINLYANVHVIDVIHQQ